MIAQLSRGGRTEVTDEMSDGLHKYAVINDHPLSLTTTYHINGANQVLDDGGRLRPRLRLIQLLRRDFIVPTER